jgi:MoxR-like ATPase
MILTAILSGGHVLLQDYPGSGKSFLAETLAACLHDDIPEEGFNIPAYRRIQCVPDLLPSDIMGCNKPAMNGEPARFIHGPIFAYFLLLDEINRTTPKLQSAMLQAMAEKKVTVDGVDKKLGEIFFVIATQNPLDKVGTYPLPGASLDRFLFKRTLEPISREATVKIIFGSGHDGETKFNDWCDSEKIPKPKEKTGHGYPDRQINATELIAATKAIERNVELSRATVNTLLKVDELIQACYDKPILRDSRITFEEGSRPSPRTLKRLAGALKVMALICKGEELEKQGVPDADIGAQLDQPTLETHPRLLRKIVADFLRHRVYPKGGGFSDKELERYLLAIADEAIKVNV